MRAAGRSIRSVRPRGSVVVRVQVRILVLVAAIGATAACTDSPTADDDDDAAAACEPVAPLAARSIAVLGPDRGPQLLATVAHGDAVGLILREQRGDRTSLCPDCNDGVLTCADCALDVLLYQPDVAADAPPVELFRWYLGASYDGVSAATAALDAAGDVAVAWQRRLGASGLSPTEARTTRVAADGSRVDPSAVLYESEGGRLRLIAHPDRGDVLALRDSSDLLARVGTWAAILPASGPPGPWMQLGSSLGYEASAATFREGFVVVYSDQYGDEATDPDCLPCPTLAECFPDGTIDPGEELPSSGCLSFYGASAAGGLQVVQLTADGPTTPVQLASGWYDRVYGGEMQTLYSDHTLTDVVPTADGFSIVSLWVDDFRLVDRWLDVDFVSGAVAERELPIDYVADSGTPRWFAQRSPGGAPTAFVGEYRRGATTDDDTMLVHAFQLQADDCVSDQALDPTRGGLTLRGASPAGGLLVTDVLDDGASLDLVAIDAR